MKKLIASIATTAALTAAVTLGAAAPTALAHNGPHANNEYVLVTDKMDWHSANAAARQMAAPGCTRAHLATVTSEAEAAIVTALVSAGGENAWIGGFQGGRTLDQHWNWITGEQSAYTNWAGGEPNDTPFGTYIAGSEQHLEVLWDAGPNDWNDAPRFETKSFVVESTHCD